jgi:hypothetical protein
VSPVTGPRVVRNDVLADVAGRGVLTDRHALGAEHSCEPVREQRGVDAGRAGEEHAALSIVDVDVSLRRLGIEKFHVLGPVTVLTVAVEEFVETGQSGLGLGDVDVAAADLVGIDVLPIEDLEDFVDRVEERRLE